MVIMKELDKTKKYDLSKLTDEQLIELCKNIGYSSKLTNGCSLYYSSHFRKWIMTTMPFGDDLEKACATEIFEDEKSNAVTWIEESNVIDVDKCNEIKFRENYNVEFNNGSSIKLYNKTMKEDDKEYSVWQTYDKEKLLNNKNMTEEEKELWLFVYKEYVSKNFNSILVDPKEKADQAIKDFRDALKM